MDLIKKCVAAFGLAVALGLTGGFVTGCEEEGAFERAGEGLDQRTEELGEGLEEQGEILEERADELE